MTRILAPLTALIAFVASAHAAVAPASKDQLVEESQHVITGKVLAVESKIQQSTVDKLPGLKDEVFLIKVKVQFVAKGADIKVGDEVVVRAWQPRKSVIPRPPGPQGHDTIPAKGDLVTCYLLESSAKGQAKLVYRAYMPNGITTDDIIEPEG